MRLLRIGIAGAIITFTLSLAAPAFAARPTYEHYFYSCVGDGPTSFYAVKTSTPEVSGGLTASGASNWVIDGSGTYQILSYGDGNFDPVGIRDASSSVNLICQVDYTIGTTTVYGYFAWTP